MKFFLFIAFFVFAAVNFAQQPAFFVLGEDELKGVQIYDVIQDQEKNYWIASNEGIFRYDYINFERVSCPDARSNSAFNFVMDDQGRIYCHNLNNQVFKIEEGKCSLFYTLKEEEAGGDVALAIADDGNLLVSSRQVVVLDQSGVVKTRKVVTKNYIGPPFSRADKKVTYHLSKSNKVLHYSKGKFTTTELSRKTEVLRFLNLDKVVYAIDLDSKEVYRVDGEFRMLDPQPGIAELERSISIRIYETKSGIWLAGTLPGVVHMGRSMLKNKAGIYYNDYFISDVYVDREGNTLLSTFDNGIMVVPDLTVSDVIGSFKDDPATALLIEDNDLLIGTSKGSLLRYSDKRFNLLNTNGNRPIEVLAANDNKVIFDDGYIRALDKRTGKIQDVVHASLKSAVYVGDDTFLLGTNRGVYRVSWLAGILQIGVIDELKVRVHRMAYEPKQQLTYISTSDGLFTVDAIGEVDRLTYKGKDVFPNDIVSHEGEIFLILREHGILVFGGRTYKRTIKPIINGETIQLKKIKFYRNGIIGSALTGLYEFDLNGKMKRSLHQQGGFSSNRIIDFVIFGDIAWVSHSGGVQKIDLDRKELKKSGVELRIDQVRANGKKLLATKRITLEANERKVHFSFVSPTLKNRETIRYHYRLIGADTNWTINDYDQNYVTFSALSPGNYTFQVKCEQNGSFSKVIKIPFEIKKPFYLTWWFASLSIVSFVLIIFLFYRRKLKQQNRKAELINELHASKLTAIQSQMNPHFIFNSLNSIQDLVLQGDVENSYTYISSFSDMVRRTLSYSDKEFITFQQEIRLLELYLSLEQLRFPDDFRYTIAINEIEDILIPPLLIQPFIENSLVHGLLHRKGQKLLKVSFELNGQQLVCVIEDNGIGREEAKKIRDRQMTDHESFSGEAIRKRFEILSDLYTGEFGYFFEDLYENGTATGTRVTLKIPVQFRF